MKCTFVAASLFAAFANHAMAGAGCDLNLRINNQSPRPITVIAPESSASKAGLNLWNPIDGLQNYVVGAEGSSTAHYKQAVELALPCWTGKLDFRIRYLDQGTEKWKNRDSVSINSGDTVQINIP